MKAFVVSSLGALLLVAGGLLLQASPEQGQQPRTDPTQFQPPLPGGPGAPGLPGPGFQPGVPGQGFPGGGDPRAEKPSKELVEALVEALKDSDPDVRKLATHALANLNMGKESVPVLVEMLKDSNPEWRKFAVNALANLNRTSVPALTDAVKSKDRDLRANAAYALGQIGSPARSALPALIKALKDDDKDVRRRVAYALDRIVGEDGNRMGEMGFAPPFGGAGGPGIPGPGGFAGGPPGFPGGSGGPGMPGMGMHHPGNTPPVDPGVLVPPGGK